MEHVHPWIAGEPVAADLVVVRGDQVEDARRDVGVAGDHVGKDHGGQRRVRRGLEDDRVAGRQSRSGLAHVHAGRCVPGSDRSDDAARFLPDAPVAPHAEHLEGGQVDFPAERAHQSDRPLDLFDHRIDEVALVGRNASLKGGHLRQVARGLLQPGRELLQALAAEIGVGRPGRRVERRAGRADGIGDVVGGGIGGSADERFIGRVDYLEGAAVRGGPQLPVDEQLAFSRPVHIVFPSRQDVLRPLAPSVCAAGLPVNTRVVHADVDPVRTCRRDREPTVTRVRRPPRRPPSVPGRGVKRAIAVLARY